MVEAGPPEAARPSPGWERGGTPGNAARAGGAEDLRRLANETGSARRNGDAGMSSTLLWMPPPPRGSYAGRPGIGVPPQGFG